MTDAVVVALITAFATITGNYLITRRSQKDDDVKRAIRQQKYDDDLIQIGKKLDEHNHYAKIISNIQKDIIVIQKDVESLKERFSYDKKDI